MAKFTVQIPAGSFAIAAVQWQETINNTPAEWVND